MKSVATFFGVIFTSLGLVGLCATTLAPGSGGGFLVQAGASAALILLLIAGVALLLTASSNSPASSLARATTLQQIHALPHEELESFVSEELCRLLALPRCDTALDLRSELRVPPGAIDSALNDLHIDYRLPISEEDAATTRTALDAGRLVASRMHDSPSTGLHS